jgi:hypothetical protein
MNGRTHIAIKRKATREKLQHFAVNEIILLIAFDLEHNLKKMGSTEIVMSSVFCLLFLSHYCTVKHEISHLFAIDSWWNESIHGAMIEMQQRKNSFGSRTFHRSVHWEKCVILTFKLHNFCNLKDKALIL